MAQVSSSLSERLDRLRQRLRGSTALVLCVGAIMVAPPARAQSVLPTGGRPSAGITIGAPAGNGLTIKQTSTRGIINWGSFSIGQPNTVTFTQPSSSAAVLNRVTGATNSTIAGGLNANGQVYLVNPNGIAITRTGSVDAGGGFVASTLGITDRDFMDGRLRFQGNGASAPVTNAGRITAARGGFVGLIGGSVANSGTIRVPLGEVGLGSGEAATIDPNGDGFMQVAVPTGATTAQGQPLVGNSGRVIAPGGQVTLSAATVATAIRDAVNLSGVVSARSISGHSGAIVLDGGPGGIVAVSGRLDVSAAPPPSYAPSYAAEPVDGGTVSIGGADVTLSGARIAARSRTAQGGSVRVTAADGVTLNAAAIDASGAGGGGAISLDAGGSVAVDAASVLRVDALADGDGGSVVVQSAGATTVAGLVSAQGGPAGGNGGTVETSGATVDFTGLTVDTLAQAGTTGTWTVDPTDLFIDDSAAATINQDLQTTSVTLTTSTSGASSSPPGIGNTPSGPNDIIVDAPHTPISWSSTSTLTLSAYNNITIDTAITVGGAGTLTLTANNTVRPGGTGAAGIAVNAPITVTANGQVALNATVDPTYSTLNLSFAQGASLSFTGGSTAGAGLTINGQAYTLLYDLTTNLTGLQSINSSGGYYALAAPIDASASPNPGTFSAAVVPSFSGTFEGLGNTISNLTIDVITAGGPTGLFGELFGTARDVGLVDEAISVPRDSTYVGGLAGVVAQSSPGDTATIANAYATGVISVGSGNGGVGGLVGGAEGTIVNAYATDAVSAGANSLFIGGLAGFNEGAIGNVYATGAVSAGGSSEFVGGLIGFNEGTIANAYATGAVSAGTSSTAVGGLAGTNQNTIANTYWDVTTSGRTTGIGSGTTSDATGLATGGTGGMQTGGTSLGAAFGGGTGGLYSYLASFYPNGVQAISGIAYKDAGVTPLASTLATVDDNTGAVTAGGPASVSAVVGGAAIGTVTTGVNGYYYIVAPAGTLAGGADVLAYTQASPLSGAHNAATFTGVSGTATTFPGLDIYGGYASLLTPATAYSVAAPTYAPTLSTAQGNNATVSAVTANLAPGYVGTGSFALDTPLDLSTGFLTAAQTGALSVAAPLTLGGADTLALLAPGGAIAVDAPISVTGAGGVALQAATNPTYHTLDLSFAQGDGLTYAETTPGSGTGIAGQALTIDGTPYTLLYSMGALQSQLTTGTAVTYALALDVTAPTTAYQSAVVPSFGGTFEGLGNTISNLTINVADNSNSVGLFGTVRGTVRDIGLVGGAVSADGGSGSYYIGELVGFNSGTVSNAYATGAVSVGSDSVDIGGLVGINEGTVSNAYATGAVSVGSGSFYVGGLVGENAGSVSNAYATGAVSLGSDSMGIGGLVGTTGGTVSNAYATGAVSVGSDSVDIGGLVGVNDSTVTNSYWDTTTSGQPTVGIGAGTNSGATGLSTTGTNGSGGMQTGGTSLGAAFGGGTGGLYPYLASFYPNGVQAISGIAYQDAGVTPLASSLATVDDMSGAVTAGGPAFVSGAVAGAGIGTVTTGANGYYYLVMPAGTIAPSGTGVVTYTQASPLSGAQNAVSFQEDATGSLAGFDIHGTYLWERATTGTLSTLSSDLASAEGTVAVPTGLPNQEIDTPASSFVVDQPLSVTGTLILSGIGATTQTQAIDAANLALLGAGGSYMLGGGGNGIGTLAANTGIVDLADASDLTIGTAAGVSGVATTGTATVTTQGTLTIAAGAAVTGQSPVLAAGGAFVNDDGSAAVTATAGRWLVYSSAPGADTFGPTSGSYLDSGDTAIFDQTYASLPPANVTDGGDRYIFANQPLLTVTSLDLSKTYGQDATASLAGDYTIGGFFDVPGAFLADTVASAMISGAPSVTSAGAPASTTVSSSPYAITIGPNTLASGAGYGFTYVSSGTLSVTPASLTITASNQSKTYGTAADLGTMAFSETGLVTANGDSISGVTLASAGAASTANVAGSPYAIVASDATGSGLSNYTITYATGLLAVDPAALAITASNQAKTYGTVADLGTTAFRETGLVTANGDSISGVTLASAGAAGTATVAGSPYAIVASDATGSGLSNYTITYESGQLAVDPAALTITASNQAKTYGTLADLGTTAFRETGLVTANGDSISGVTLASGGAASTANVAGSPYAIVASDATGSGLSNYTITYLSGLLTVDPAALTITASNQAKAYGTSAALGTTAFTQTGLVTANGDSISGVTLASAGAASTANVAGSPYAIVASDATGSGLSNYTITYLSGLLTVDPAALTITASNQAKAYGTSAALGTTAFTQTGLVTANGDSISGVTLASAGAASTANVAGSPYAIVASDATGSGLSNYTITYASGLLTVNPAALTITADDETKTAGQGFTFTGAAFTAAGLQNGETVGSATLASAGAPVSASPAGSPYAITASDATGGTFDAGNYAINYVDGELTVTSATPGVPPMPGVPSVGAFPSAKQFISFESGRYLDLNTTNSIAFVHFCEIGQIAEKLAEGRRVLLLQSGGVVVAECQ